MVVGVPRETHRHEHRVGLTPFAVARLVQGIGVRFGQGYHFGRPGPDLVAEPKKPEPIKRRTIGQRKGKTASWS